MVKLVDSLYEEVKNQDPTNPNTDLGKVFDDPIGTAESGIDKLTDIAKENPFLIGIDPLGVVVTDLLRDALTPDIPDLGALIKGVEINRVSANAYIPVIYGRQRVGGVVTFLGVSGTDNEYLHIVLTVCEGEIEDFETVYINDIESTDAKYTTDSLVTVTEYYGTATETADSDLITNFPGKWTSAHRGDYLAKLHVKCKWKSGIFSSAPRITTIVKGKKLYDPRTTLTAYSTNPALVLYDYLTNSRYSKGISSSFLDGVNAAADECDTLIIKDGPSGTEGTHKQFEFNGVVDTGRKVFDNIKSIASTFRCKTPFVNGKYTFIIDKDETPTFTFDKSNIIGGWSVTGVDTRNKYNSIKVGYRNPDKNWKYDEVSKSSATFLTNDNNEVLETLISRQYETDYWRALDHGFYALKKSRYAKVISFVATHKAIVNKVGDVVYLTHDRVGFTNKKYRIIKMGMPYSGRYPVTLVEHEPIVFDRELNTADIVPSATDLPDPDTVVAPTGLTATSGNSTYDIINRTIVPRIKLTWTKSADIYVEQYEIEMKKTADSVYNVVSVVPGRDNEEVFISGVSIGISYDLRIRAKNSAGNYSSYDTVSAHAVLGKSTNPTSPTNLTFTAIQGGGTLSWTVPADLDLSHVRIYQAATNNRPASTPLKTSSGVPGATQDYPVSFQPGTTNYFWIDFIDSSGNPSAATFPVSSTAGVQGTAGQYQFPDVDGRPNIFRVVSVGFSSTSHPATSRLADENGTVLKSGGRSYNLSVYDRATEAWDSHTTYDVHASSANATSMANALNALGSNKIIVIFTSDDPHTNRLQGGLPAAIYRCGGSRAVFATGSEDNNPTTSKSFKYRSSYILIGVPGVGEGNGIEMYSGDANSDTDAWCETTFTIFNGNIELGTKPADAKTLIEDGIDTTTGSISDGTKISLDYSLKRFSLNNSSFGAKGGQWHYDSIYGANFYTGDGGNKFLKVLNGDTSIGRDSKILGADTVNDDTTYLHWVGSSWTDNSGGGTFTEGSYAVADSTTLLGGRAEGSYFLQGMLSDAIWDKDRIIKGIAVYSYNLTSTNKTYFITGSYLWGHYFGFCTIGNNIYGVSHDGTTESLTSSLGTVTVATSYKLEARKISGVIEFFINDVSKGTKSNNVPSGTSLSDYADYWITVVAINGVSRIKISAGETKVWQNE